MQPQPLENQQDDWEFIPYTASAELSKPLLSNQLATQSREQLIMSLNKLVKSLKLNTYEKRFFTCDEQNELFDDISSKLHKIVEQIKTIRLQHNPNLHVLAYITHLLEELLKSQEHARQNLNITIMNQIIDSCSVSSLLTKHHEAINTFISEKQSAIREQNHNYVPIDSAVTKQSLQKYIDYLYEQQSLLSKCRLISDEEILEGIRRRLTHINQMIDKYEVEQILMNLEYELWFERNIARPSFRGFDCLFNIYSNFLNNLDFTLMYCQSYASNRDVIGMMNRNLSMKMRHEFDLIKEYYATRTSVFSCISG